MIISSDQEHMTTQDCFRELRQYYLGNGLEPEAFKCTSRAKCKNSCHLNTKPNRQFIEGGLAYIGSQYDTKVAEGNMRILFVGYDFGNTFASLEQRRTDIEGYRPPLNAHYNGVVKVLMEIFEQNCESGADVQNWRSLLVRMAQTNVVRCCVPENGTMQTHATQTMWKNCWPHFREELRILRPTLVVFQGKSLKRFFLRQLGIDGIEAKPHALWGGLVPTLRREI
jgi:hypothetical protein